MEVLTFYEELNRRIPGELSCNWDNDGLMCCPEPKREVKRVLICLDATAKMVDTAIREKYDVIVTHHPLVFHKLSGLTTFEPVPNKLISLVRAGISVMSFHTRLDAVQGGVNDTLAQVLGLEEAVPYGEEQIGRIGHLKEPMSLMDFAKKVKDILGVPSLTVSDAGKQVFKVAVLGGSGSDDVLVTEQAGADTYVTGEIAFHHLSDAPERGMNLIAADHFYTENPVCMTLKSMIYKIDSTIETQIFNSNSAQMI